MYLSQRLRLTKCGTSSRTSNATCHTKFASPIYLKICVVNCKPVSFRTQMPPNGPLPEYSEYRSTQYLHLPRERKKRKLPIYIKTSWACIREIKRTTRKMRSRRISGRLDIWDVAPVKIRGSARGTERTNPRKRMSQGRGGAKTLRKQGRALSLKSDV